MTNKTKNVKLLYHLPLQQGLRLNTFEESCRVCFAPIPSSTTTRIKTLGDLELCGLGFETPIPSSTTTRIKTCFKSSISTSDYILLYHLPLQQGLRLSNTMINTVFTKILLYHLPLQQGLRLLHYVICAVFLIGLLYHLPLQQGLRLVC